MKILKHYFLWEKFLYFPQLISQQILPRIQNTTNFLRNSGREFLRGNIVLLQVQGGRETWILPSWKQGLFQGVKKEGGMSRDGWSIFIEY